MIDTLYIVVPCFNEEEVLPETSKRLKDKIMNLINSNKISSESKILFVNDGSSDNTWNIIKNLHKQDNLFLGISLSRNCGHQNALLAGLFTASDYADITISLDADLQDDINVIDKFIEEYYKGNDIVYGVRNSRKTDTFFKRTTALFFYKFMNFLGVNIVYNHADYRLLSKKCINHLKDFNEVNLFLRGLIPLIGFNSSTVEYERKERFAGKSKYPLKKMISFAIDGITSFSTKPLSLISLLGLIVCFIGIILLISNIFYDNLLTVSSIWIVGGLNLLSLGIVGIYVGKIYGETKNRPKYIISEKLI